jgi:hypothetical protein
MHTVIPWMTNLDLAGVFLRHFGNIQPHPNIQPEHFRQVLASLRALPNNPGTIDKQFGDL